MDIIKEGERLHIDSRLTGSENDSWVTMVLVLWSTLTYGGDRLISGDAGGIRHLRQH